MQIYLVGGAVRDSLLGLPVQDRDWVVVGGTPQQLLDQGFMPVGRDFPVFLHPVTREEYALARTERKTAPGYQGFAIHAAPDVTLAQDLARRDLTINAIALDAAQLRPDGSFDASQAALEDPFHGRRDLQSGVLRHVTDAFREDPVRILRVARFAARFAHFTVAPETLELMQAMVGAGETAALVAERVWQELARGLMEATPSRMVTLLRDCGAWQVILPELDHVPGTAQARTLRALDQSARRQAGLAARFACLCLHASPAPGDAADRHGRGPVAALCERLRVPSDCRAMAEVARREGAALQDCETLAPPALVRLLERCDALRQPARFAELVLAMECDAAAGGWQAQAPYPPAALLHTALAAAQAVATADIAARAQAEGMSGPQIGARVHAARVAAVTRALGISD